jgi:hypothetical protein
MNVYLVEYWSGEYGAFEQRSYVVFAMNAENAEKKVANLILGILGGREKSPTEFFDVRELDPLNKEVWFISEKSN